MRNRKKNNENFWKTKTEIKKENREEEIPSTKELNENRFESKSGKD